MRKKLIDKQVLSVGIALILCVTIIIFPNVVTAQQTNASYGFTLFGGKSYETTYCSCTPGCFKMLILGVTGNGYYMWCPWTATYAYGYIWPIAWQLGKATIYMACMQVHGEECDSDGGGEVIFMLGTSVAL